jgi:hypothetical protein
VRLGQIRDAFLAGLSRAPRRGFASRYCFKAFFLVIGCSAHFTSTKDAYFLRDGFGFAFLHSRFQARVES